MRVFLGRWVPVFAWAVIIFLFSTEQFSAAETSGMIHRLVAWVWPGVTPEQLDAANYAARKLGHWGGYFAFGLLLARALQPEPRRSWDWRRAWWALLILLLYASGDELHQAFVPGRSASFADVLLDFFGGFSGVLWLYLWRRWRMERACSACVSSPAG